MNIGVYNLHMSFIPRHLENSLDVFRNKLIILSGPRQCGKSSLLRKHFSPDLTLNLDDSFDRLNFKKITLFLNDWIKNQTLQNHKTTKPCVFIDEVHRVNGWRNLLKAAYDKFSDQIQFVVSGSSAFNLRKQDRGDSLAGRAIWLQLSPISFREYFIFKHPNIKLPKPYQGETPIASMIKNLIPHAKVIHQCWREYIQYGSFPELLIRKNETFSREWLKNYIRALLDRDLKDLSSSRDAERCFQVYELLMQSLGSHYSMRSIATTLSVSPITIKGDILALRQVLWGFELHAIGTSKARQIQSEKKFFPIDFSLSLQDSHAVNGAQFECMVACLLYRGLNSQLKANLGKLELGYFRNYQKREIDFILRQGKTNLLAVECKLGSKHESETLIKFDAVEKILLTWEPNIFNYKNDVLHLSSELLMLLLA